MNKLQMLLLLAVSLPVPLASTIDYDPDSKTLRVSASEAFSRGVGDTFTCLKGFVVGRPAKSVVEQIVIPDCSLVSIEQEQLKALLGQLVRLHLESPDLKMIKLLDSESRAYFAGAALNELLQELLHKDEEIPVFARKPYVPMIELGGAPISVFLVQPVQTREIGGAQVSMILLQQFGVEATVKTIQMGDATVQIFVSPVSTSFRCNVVNLLKAVAAFFAAGNYLD